MNHKKPRTRKAQDDILVPDMGAPDEPDPVERTDEQDTGNVSVPSIEFSHCPMDGSVSLSVTGPTLADVHRVFIELGEAIGILVRTRR